MFSIKPCILPNKAEFFNFGSIRFGFPSSTRFRFFGFSIRTPPQCRSILVCANTETESINFDRSFRRSILTDHAECEGVILHTRHGQLLHTRHNRAVCRPVTKPGTLCLIMSGTRLHCGPSVANLKLCCLGSRTLISCHVTDY